MGIILGEAKDVYKRIGVDYYPVLIHFKQPMGKHMFEEIIKDLHTTCKGTGKFNEFAIKFDRIRKHFWEGLQKIIQEDLSEQQCALKYIFTSANCQGESIRGKEKIKPLDRNRAIPNSRTLITPTQRLPLVGRRIVLPGRQPVTPRSVPVTLTQRTRRIPVTTPTTFTKVILTKQVTNTQKQTETSNRITTTKIMKYTSTTTTTSTTTATSTTVTTTQIPARISRPTTSTIKTDTTKRNTPKPTTTTRRETRSASRICREQKLNCPMKLGLDETEPYKQEQTAFHVICSCINDKPTLIGRLPNANLRVISTDENGHSTSRIVKTTDITINDAMICAKDFVVIHNKMHEIHNWGKNLCGRMASSPGTSQQNLCAIKFLTAIQENNTAEYFCGSYEDIMHCRTYVSGYLCWKPDYKERLMEISLTKIPSCEKSNRMVIMTFEEIKNTYNTTAFDNCENIALSPNAPKQKVGILTKIRQDTTKIGSKIDKLLKLEQLLRGGETTKKMDDILILINRLVNNTGQTLMYAEELTGRGTGATRRLRIKKIEEANAILSRKMNELTVQKNEMQTGTGNMLYEFWKPIVERNQTTTDKDPSFEKDADKFGEIRSKRDIQSQGEQFFGLLALGLMSIVNTVMGVTNRVHTDKLMSNIRQNADTIKIEDANILAIQNAMKKNQQIFRTETQHINKDIAILANKECNDIIELEIQQILDEIQDVVREYLDKLRTNVYDIIIGSVPQILLENGTIQKLCMASTLKTEETPKCVLGNTIYNEIEAFLHGIIIRPVDSQDGYGFPEIILSTLITMPKVTKLQGVVREISQTGFFNDDDSLVEKYKKMNTQALVMLDIEGYVYLADLKVGGNKYYLLKNKICSCQASCVCYITDLKENMCISSLFETPEKKSKNCKYIRRLTNRWYSIASLEGGKIAVMTKESITEWMKYKKSAANENLNGFFYLYSGNSTIVNSTKGREPMVIHNQATDTVAFQLFDVTPNMRLIKHAKRDFTHLATELDVPILKRPRFLLDAKLTPKGSLMIYIIPPTLVALIIIIGAGVMWRRAKFLHQETKTKITPLHSRAESISLRRPRKKNKRKKKENRKSAMQGINRTRFLSSSKSKS